MLLIGRNTDKHSLKTMAKKSVSKVLVGDLQSNNGRMAYSNQTDFALENNYRRCGLEINPNGENQT